MEVPQDRLVRENEPLFVPVDPRFAPSAPPLTPSASPSASTTAKPSSKELLSSASPAASLLGGSSIKPASKELMSSVLESFEESELDHIEASARFKKLTAEELKEVIDWISANPALLKSDFVCVTKGEKRADEPLPTPGARPLAFALLATFSSARHHALSNRSTLLA